MQVGQQLRERIDQWDSMKLKSFCTTKEKVSKLKRQSKEWEKNLASYKCNKRDCKENIQEAQKTNYPKINDPMKKWANELNRALSKEKVKMAKNLTRKCSTFLAIKELQIKSMVRFYFTPV
jgi:hypothetical protein